MALPHRTAATYMLLSPDDSYEPDWEDLAYLAQREKEFESLLLKHDHLDLGLCDCHNKPDRKLRIMSRDRKAIARKLSRAWYFDVTTDTFEVLSDDLDHFASIPREGSLRREGPDCKFPRPLSRKDKRRAKTNQRKTVRRLNFSMNAKSAQSSMVRKTGALLPVVAA